MTRRLSTWRLLSLFLLCLSLVAYELVVMRVFAVGSWSNFGSMVISIALLGYGLAGTVLTLLEKRISARPDAWLGWTAGLLGPAMALAHCVAQLVPFNPVMITTDRMQLWWIASYYVLYSVPFLIGALFIGASFIAFRSRIHVLYFWNMLGSGLGGFLVLGLLWLLPTDRLLGPLVAVATLSALLAMIGRDARSARLSLPFGRVFALIGTLALSLVALALFGEIHVSEWKPASYAKDFPDVRHVYHAFGPTGELDAYRSSYFHLAPGLSDNASSGLTAMPNDAFLGLYVDGDGPIGIMRRLSDREEAYFDYLPMAAPYLLLDRPRVLLLRMGGGIGAYAALHHGARSVTVVEPDPALVHMLRDVPFFRKYTGEILADPRIDLHSTEPRAFAESSKAKFDLAEISLVDSVGLSQTGGYPVVENYLYTAEGISSYLDRLAPGGILSISVWNRLSPPRNVPKLIATVIEAMRRRGSADPARNLFVFDQLLSTATILVKNGPFDSREIAALRGFCARMSFIPCWYPGMPEPATGLDEVLKTYREQLFPPPIGEAASSADASGAAASGTSASTAGAAAGGVTRGAIPADEAADFLQEDLYYWTVAALTMGSEARYRDGYVFAVAPATDDRPYYTAYVKPGTVGAVAANIKDLSEEWGYLLLVATLILSLCFGILIILIPMIGRRRELFSRGRGTIRVIVYFAALGIGYMLVEIFLIQRLTFFLVDPIFSNSIVITTMLVMSGLGSLASGSSAAPRRTWVAVAAAGVALSAAFYVFALPTIVSDFLGLALPLKIGLSVLFIAPAGFSMGIPFPTGLSSLSKSRPGLVPWAWGVNGALSVTGTVLARLVSVSGGFALVLSIAAGLYVLALLCFSGNEAEKAG